MRRGVGLLFAAITFLSLPYAAPAQQSLEVVPPAPQSEPSLRPRPAPTTQQVLPPSQPLQVIPRAIATPAPPAPQTPTPTPPPPPSSTLNAQPILPAIFRGCWDGRVDFLDSIERAYGGAKPGVWTPKTYRICYQRIGSGPFQLTFSQVGIDPSTKIVNPTGRMDLISTDGRDAARMRALLHFDEFYVHRHPGEQTFGVDEEAILDCDIGSNGAMAVRGQVFGRRNGSPWFRATWHAVFSRVGGLPE